MSALRPRSTGAAHLLIEHAGGRFSSRDLLRAYAAELTQPADSEDERRAATGRMLDHYLHTAYSAALQLHPTRRRITLAEPQPGAAPEPISDAAQALAWWALGLRPRWLREAGPRRRDTATAPGAPYAAFGPAPAACRHGLRLAEGIS